MTGSPVGALRGSPIRTLLAGAIDYAGLFPPAALPMREAVRNYAAYRDSADAWALGRFVVPDTRLAEFEEAARDVLPAVGSPWRVSAVARGGERRSLPAGVTREDGDRANGGAVVDALEVRVAAAAEVQAIAAEVRSTIDVFYEVPIDEDPTQLIVAIGCVGGKAKVRTGGVTREAFPPAADLARFVGACARAKVAFKATAGLHHPVRSTYRLTYEPDSITGEMFGFLNVLLAAAFVRGGLEAAVTIDLLEERDASAFRFSPKGVDWRGRHVSTATLAETRSTAALSFGSCSFREPIDELETLGIP